MADESIRFDDGAKYERMMGVWSRIAGDIFLDWLAPAPGLKWADIGCGNGAFSEVIVERCAPVEVQGIDPSAEQVEFARQRHRPGVAQFQQGDAMALPFATNSFDAAAMALVIFFVPRPAVGVAEMARVVRPGGSVAAYAWDIEAGGMPFAPINGALGALGLARVSAPFAEASTIPNLTRLWSEAGLVDVETRTITVERPFESFDEFWESAALNNVIATQVAGLTPEQLQWAKQDAMARVARDEAGRLVFRAHANAVKGRVPN